MEARRDGTPFPIRFTGSLRPSQTQAIDLARKELAGGGRKLHIVAPPGSGKTVLGLYLWAECVRRPALVLAPNSAIQAQWAARMDLFEVDPTCTNPVSTDPQSPGLLTSLTYQAVTLPRREGDDLDALAMELWQNRLIEKGQAKDPAEATVWIEDLRRHNPAYFEERSRRVSQGSTGRDRPGRRGDEYAARFVAGDSRTAARSWNRADYPRRVSPPDGPLGTCSGRCVRDARASRRHRADGDAAGPRRQRLPPTCNDTTSSSARSTMRRLSRQW